MNRKKRLIAAALAALIAVPLAYAANVHFKRGSPTFNDQGTTLQACLKLTGLGNGDVTITLNASGFATTLCTNPGGNTAPGQNKTPVSSTGQTSIPSTEIKNGNLSACVTTTQPPAPSPRDAGCPNNNWSTSLQDVEFTSAEIIVEQGGNVVLDQTFTP
jgi:hypothetical protein